MSERVQAWAAWHPEKCFGQTPHACWDMDEAINDAKCATILDDSPLWKAVRVEIVKLEAAPVRAAAEPIKDTDCEMAFIEACDEIGCAYDNEALLQAISDLKLRAAAELMYTADQVHAAVKKIVQEMIDRGEIQMAAAEPVNSLGKCLDLIDEWDRHGSIDHSLAFELHTKLKKVWDALSPASANEGMQDYIEKLELDLAFCREAMRFADIDLSMILPEVANREMQKSIRTTLDRIDEARRRSTSPLPSTERGYWLAACYTAEEAEVHIEGYEGHTPSTERS